MEERQRERRAQADSVSFKPSGAAAEMSSVPLRTAGVVTPFQNSSPRTVSQQVVAPKDASLGVPTQAAMGTATSRQGRESGAAAQQRATTSNTPPPTVTSGLTGAGQPSASRSRGPNCIVVNKCQKGNGVLNHIRNVPWEYGEIIPDYQVGQTSCALFLSLKYHRLHPEYIHTRIKQLGHHYLLRILLCLVDIDDHQQSIRDLTRTCMYSKVTLILAWSQEEAGRYLETFKAYEHKPPDMIKERVDADYLSKLTDALTQVKSVNKTDVVTLASTFGSLKDIISAKPEELALCPGFGEQKVRRLHEAFNQPFILNKKRRTG
ncbi:ssDNA endonuclease and repair protein rad10 [Borealophlyctis nickersoniae]|nr:ssDNA endonuclease and repair protein rad10 [Borealophlyctis nickersoniae]